MTDVDTAVLRQQLAQAYTRAVHPDARQHIHAALRELDEDVPLGLVECHSCDCVGLPKRVGEHDC